MMFSLPLLIKNVKKSNNVAIYIAFSVAAIYVILYGYNRMHMTNHFLSDVCFGTLFTYIVFSLVDYGCSSILIKKE